VTTTITPIDTATPTKRRLTPRRTVLLIFGILLTVATIGWGVFSIVDLLAHQTKVADKTFTVSSKVIDISVDGKVTLIATPTATEHVLLHRKMWFGLNKPHVSETVRDGRLVVRGGCNNVSSWCDVRYTLRVPADYTIHAHSSGDNVNATGFSGNLDMSSSGGAVKGDELLSDEVDASSSGGSVKLTFVDDPRRVSANSSGGGVTVVVPHDNTVYRVVAHSSGGNTNVNIPTNPDADRSITATSSGGNVSVDTA